MWKLKRMGTRPERSEKRSLLSRLARDTRGNITMIVAASILPLLALIGSGIDMSRAYMAQARLQLACDAASLAGRRAMSAGMIDTTVRNEVTKFFNFNFPQGSFQTAAFTPVTTGGENSTVIVTASTTIPTAIMRMFGFATLPLSVTCNAKQDFVNTDIVLVLDTTGSMADSVGGSVKIVSLRAAVLALYDELKPVQDQLAAGGLRLRYGIVPYSSGVNVGKVIRAVNASYIASDNWTYQSRKARYSNIITATNTETAGSSLSSADCVIYGAAAANTTVGDPTVVTTYSYRDWGATGDTSGTSRTCRRYANQVSTYSTPQFTGWDYEPVTHDISTYVTGASTPTPTRTPGTTSNSTWAGCIEERETVSTITSASGYTIPTGAKDLNIDLIPTGDKTTKWKPYWPEVVYRRDNGNQPQIACPVEAKRLQTWTRANLSTYLDTLNPTGGTYHDNGMIWGARFISPNGIFAADNPNTYGNMPVSRFIIYMTDGLIDTGDTLYSTYGSERWDARVTGGWTSDADQTSRHNQRFKMMCNATKGMNVSIWVVAFASALDSTLTECASSTSQASTSANQAALIAKFVEIGKNIGSLRLTQ